MHAMCRMAKPFLRLAPTTAPYVRSCALRALLRPLSRAHAPILFFLCVTFFLSVLRLVPEPAPTPFRNPEQTENKPTPKAHPEKL